MNMLPVWTAIQRKRKKTPFPFLLAHSFPLQSYPLNPCLLISPILSEQNPWKKDFSMAFKPISRKAMATGAGMLDLRFPYPPYSHLLLLVSGLTLVCHRVDVIMRCSVCPAEWRLSMTIPVIALYENLCLCGESWIFSCRYLSVVSVYELVSARLWGPQWNDPSPKQANKQLCKFQTLQGVGVGSVGDD